MNSSIETLSKIDPLVHMYMGLYQQGSLSKEEALEKALIDAIRHLRTLEEKVIAGLY